MTPERWQQVKQVLATVLELDPEERASYLDHCYAEDESLQAEVEPLLDSGQRLREGFLGEDDLAAAARALPASEISPVGYWVGHRVGPYKVIEQIGAGGMAEVYRAFRADDQYQKEVAIKFVRAGQFGNSVFARFKIERQILAGLDHPNLARLLDGGATEEGVPYLVMELIEGQVITGYCSTKDLPLRKRLQLFLQVCAAVHYAHQHLVIHRDIKPQNILVTTDGIPKLLDFGIARILEPDSADSLADLTVTGFRALTPRYASPEQIKGEAMTTATDVYSLGIVLYELLTGLGPYEMANVAMQDVPRIVCEKEIQKPSLAALRTRLEPDSHSFRDISPEKLSRQLKGDLDNIVLMALRKEPSRRYASVNDFQEDIRRHLENIPVIARKDAFWYRANRFAVRHKGGVAATAAVALILIAGIVITMREARIAKQRFDDVRALATSLIFDVHDAVKDLPGSTPARKIIVDRALKYLNVLARESTGDIQLQRELATAYEKVGSVQGDYLENNLGDFEGTLVSYKKALELRKQISASSKDWNDRLALAQGYRLVAHQLWANGDPRGARDPIGRAIAVSETINREQPNNLKILGELSFDHEVSGRIGYPGDSAANQKVLGDYRRALAVDEAAIKIQPDDVPFLHGYATELGNVGNKLEASDPLQALDNYKKALEIDLRLTKLSTDIGYRRSVAIAYGSIASVYDDIGDYPHAVENNMKDLAIYQDLVRSDPKNVLLRQGIAIVYTNTAIACGRAGQIATALDYSNRGVEIIQSLASSGPQNAFQQYVFAAILIARGTILTTANQPGAAATELKRGRSIYESLYKAGNTNHANIAAADVKLGEACAKAGLDREAAEYFHQALTIVEPLISSAPADLDAKYAAADAYSGLGNLSMKAARHPGLNLEQRRLSWTEARSWCVLSLSAWRRIDHPNHTAPNFFQAGDPAVVVRNVKLTDAALASLH
jgi:eukaryotic-like serine/threonine-protein kinase